ncbi:hypothetical protein [Lederbergia panacisoli]|uniref:hypothetical protein n=1 Tax=Lederbergia panacisoli TaxID=1255251 RepID=UPI00214C5211|nr:hypothetical protein [Lederbergia panacisoli]MCR2823286.1 hypothetical protein [Lederbergia panacisoli]
MKRYWKSILLCMVIVIVLGSFYMKSSLAAQKPMKIEFEKISGNEDEIDDLILYGGYDMGNQYSNWEITKNGTRERSHHSLIQELTKTYATPALGKLIKEHKQFMRGKGLNQEYFYEDEQLIAYAYMEGPGYDGPTNHSLMDIALLNKESKKITSFKADIPNKEKYYWGYVQEVQLVDGQLKVFTQGFPAAGGSDLNVYTFDLAEQKLVDAVLIASAKADEVNIAIINGYSIQPQKYVLINVEEYNHSDNGDEMKNVLADTIIYNIETNESQKVAISDDERPPSLYSGTISDSSLFVPAEAENGIEIREYDIEAEKWINKRTFALPYPTREEGGGVLELMNGRVYNIQSTNDGQAVFIGDLRTGESLYEGKLRIKDPGKDKVDNRLEIYSIEQQ